MDIGQLEQLLVTFSDLVAEQPRIKEIDINPLLIWPGGLVALDARMILHDAECDPSQLPKPAIRRYPDRFIKEITAADGTTLTIRPIRPEDEPLLVKFHYGLSERSVYLRYFNAQNIGQRTSHERLIRSCFIDYNRQIAFVAERDDPNSGERAIIGVGKLVRSPRDNSAELAATVIDAFQGREIGQALVTQLVDFARAEKIEHVIAVVMIENRAMRSVLKRAGFTFRDTSEMNVLQAELNLHGTAAAPES